MKQLSMCILLACFTAGCQSSLFDQHAKEFDVMRGLAAQAASGLREGAYSQMQVSGQGLNPGIVLEAAIVYRASAKYDGLAGQFAVSSAGQASGFRDDELARRLATMSADEANALRGLIGAAVERATGAQENKEP